MWTRTLWQLTTRIKYINRLRIIFNTIKIYTLYTCNRLHTAMFLQQVKTIVGVLHN